MRKFTALSHPERSGIREQAARHDPGAGILPFSHPAVGKVFLFSGLNELRAQVILERSDQTSNFRLYPFA